MRYLFFIVWYRQWFKNHEGIKGFAHQAMNWLMRSTLNLASKLKKQNKQLAENIKELSTELSTRISHPTIDADEYAALKGKIQSYSIIFWICIIGEAFFNFFASKALFNFDGWLAFAAQLIFAILITWIAIALFENLFYNILYEKPYKGEHKEQRHWGRTIALIIMAIGYESFIYYICKVRGLQIEGGKGDGIIATTMLIAGMLIPIIAGYYAYEKRRYIAPYKNTLRIEKLRKLIAAKENRIAINLQKMENHFKHECEEKWAYLQEFKIYKENYNRKHGIPAEDLTGHYSATQDDFRQEAINRYKKDSIQDETLRPDRIITLAKQNGHNEKMKELFINL